MLKPSFLYTSIQYFRKIISRKSEYELWNTLECMKNAGIQWKLIGNPEMCCLQLNYELIRDHTILEWHYTNSLRAVYKADSNKLSVTELVSTIYCYLDNILLMNENVWLCQL